MSMAMILDQSHGIFLLNIFIEIIRKWIEKFTWDINAQTVTKKMVNQNHGHQS